MASCLPEASASTAFVRPDTHSRPARAPPSRTRWFARAGPPRTPRRPWSARGSQGSSGKLFVESGDVDAARRSVLGGLLLIAGRCAVGGEEDEFAVDHAWMDPYRFGGADASEPAGWWGAAASHEREQVACPASRLLVARVPRSSCGLHRVLRRCCHRRGVVRGRAPGNGGAQAATESGAEVNGWRSVVYFSSRCPGSLTCGQ